jgi:hypothetical protein
MDREPDPWQSGEPGPFLTVGEVEVWALGEQRFRVVWPDGERVVEGYKRAEQVAKELARV